MYFFDSIAIRFFSDEYKLRGTNIQISKRLKYKRKKTLIKEVFDL